MRGPLEGPEGRREGGRGGGGGGGYLSGSQTDRTPRATLADQLLAQKREKGQKGEKGNVGAPNLSYIAVCRSLQTLSIRSMCPRLQM